MGYPWSRPIRRGDSLLASDMTELRNEIKHKGDLAGLNPPITWNPASINPGDRILASHFRDMRAAIQRLWTSKSRGPLPMWSSGVRPGGPSENTPPTPMRASDIRDLRLWLDIYIDNHPRYGMDTKSYDAAARNRPLVDFSGSDNWIHDISDLMPESPSYFMVRCVVNGPVVWPTSDPDDSYPIAWSATDRNHYHDAFNRIRQHSGAVVYPVLSPGFDPYGARHSDIVSQPLDSNFTNSAIDNFAESARIFMNNVANAGVNNVIIWNEPNVSATYLPAEKFSALMYNTYKAVASLGLDINIFWGGVQVVADSQDPDAPDDASVAYIKSVYDAIAGFSPPVYLSGQRITPEAGPWPWHGINVHVHRWRSRTFVDSLADQLNDKIRNDRGQEAVFLIGECGITTEDYGDGVRLTGASGDEILQFLFYRFDIVCLFSHQSHFESGHGHWGTREFGEDPPSSYPNRSTTGRFWKQPFESFPVGWKVDLEPYWNHAKTSFARLRAISP